MVRPSAIRRPKLPSWTGKKGLLLLLPALFFLCLFYLVPLVQVLVLSLRDDSWSLVHYGRIFQDPLQLKVLSNTVKLALGVAAVTLLAGYPVAYFLATAGDRLRRLLMAVILASLWMSVLVRSYAWMVLLARQGPVNLALQGAGLINQPLSLLYGDFSVYAGMVHIMLPFMILPLLSVMQRIDSRLVNSAQSLGASPFIAFWFVFFPLTLPGVLAGTLLVFILSIGFFITPALLGGIESTTFVMLIEREVSQYLNWELAAAMSIVLLGVTLMLVMVYQKLLLPGEHSSHGSSRLRACLSGGLRSLLLGSTARIGSLLNGTWLALNPASPFARGRRYAGHLLASSVPWLVIAFLLTPMLIIFPLSFSAAPFLEFPPSAWSLRWYEVIFSRPDWVNPALTSIQVALAVMLVATCLGVMAAVPLSRWDFRFKPIVYGFLLSPMIVPVIVLAVSMHFFSARIGTAGTLQALIFGHVVVALPFVIIVMTSALRSFDVNLERTARTLGAPPFIAFSRITLRLVRPAVLTSALFAFLASFDELVIALFLAGPTTKTLPKRLWEAVREEIDPTAAAVAVVITLVCLAAIWSAETARAKVGARLNRAPVTVRARSMKPRSGPRGAETDAAG